MLILDAHLHVWNRLHGRLADGTPVTAAGGGRVRIGEAELLGMPASFDDSLALAERVVGEWDAAGVAGGVVVQEYLDGEQNDYLLEVQSAHPGRFFAYALPDLYAPDSACAEVEALLARGFRGMKICAEKLAGQLRLDDPRLLAAWRAVEAADGYLAIDLSEGEEQVAEVEAILDACPGVRIAIGHFGMPSRGGWPGQLDLCRHDAVRMECGGIIWLYRNEGPAFPDALAAIRHAGDTVGFDKLMWGSDWPRTMVDYSYAQSLDFVRAAPAEQLTDADKRAFLGGTAAEFYGMALEPRAPMPRITEG